MPGAFYALRWQVPPAVPAVGVVHARHHADVFSDLDGRYPLHVEVAGTFSAA